LSAVLFWTNYLNPKIDLFASRDHPLTFGNLLTFDLEVGINDKQWSAQDPNPPPEGITDAEDAFLPFDEEPST